MSHLANTTQLNDSNGNPWLGAVATANAVSYLQVTNNVSGSAVSLAVVGGTNTPFILKGNGTGLLTIRPGADSTDALRIQNAAGSATAFGIDTTNKRVTINGTGLQANSNLSVLGSLSYTRTTVADANYTAVATDLLIAYTSLSASRTLTLPSAASITGRLYIIKDETGTAGTNNVTVTTTASQTIDGVASKVINTNYGTIKVYSNGANWFSI